MKSYKEYQESLISEESGVDPKDSKMWTDFTHAARALERLLNTRHSLHALILNDIDHALQGVKDQLNREDTSKHWRDEIRTRGGRTTQ